MTKPEPPPPRRNCRSALRPTRCCRHGSGFASEGQVMVSPGKVEIGQGIVTALAQIAADELDVDFGRVQMVRASTAGSPNEGVTSGSLSVQQSGRAIRHACAEIRQIFLAAASDQPGRRYRRARHQGRHDFRTRQYQDQLLGTRRRNLAGSRRDAGRGAEASAQRALAGNSVQRLDIPDKVFAHPRFIHDQALPGMLHGRVLRSEMSAAKLTGMKEDAARAVAGLVAIVRDGNFAGVVSETEDGAEAALKALRKGATWSAGETLPDEDGLAAFLKAQPAESTVIDKRTASAPAKRSARSGGNIPAPISPMPRSRRPAPWRSGAETASTSGPTARGSIFSAPISRSCSNCRSRTSRSSTWKAPAATDITPPTTSRSMPFCWRERPAAGRSACNGRARTRCRTRRSARRWRSRSRPISMRRARLPAGATASGATATPRGRGARRSLLLLAATELSNPFPRYIATNPPQANGGGADRNSIPLYDFPSWQIECHRLLTMPIRTSALRTLGAQGNVFAIESFLDELAAERGEDPVAFRLRHLSDQRAKDVIRAVARRANWKPDKRAGLGYGLGFARYKNTGAYCAVVAEVEGAEDISVKRLTIAVDVGEAINPDGVVNQIEGGAIQATSWVLKERVRFDRQRITSNTWTDYPILRFSEVPEVQVELIQRPDSDPLGAGEAAHGPVTAAIANAVFDALELRVRNLPITRDSLIAAMELSFMNSLNILSGGAAQGLVASLAPKFRAADRVRHRGRVRRGRRHGRQIAQGHARRHCHTDGENHRGSCRREPCRPRLDIRRRPGRNRDRGPRRRSPGHGQRRGCVADALLAADAIFVPDTKASTAGIHGQKSCNSSASPMPWPPGSRSIRTARPRCAIWPRPTRCGRSAARNRPRSSALKAWCCRVRCRRDASSRPCIRRR